MCSLSPKLALAAVRDGATDIRLLVPTATMAGHLRHQLAREGLLVRPCLIQTLSQFIEPLVAGLAQVSAGQLQVLLAEVLEQGTPPEFGKVARLPGFLASLARLIDEFSAAGFDSLELGEALDQFPYGAAFRRVYARVEEELAERDWSLRGGRLRCAAECIRQRGIGGVQRLFFEGFFTFTDPELELINELRQYAGVAVSLPEWRGAGAARVALLAMGLEEERSPGQPRPAAKTTLFTAPGLEQEAEEITRRILLQVEAGRAFREIGVIVRGEEPYVPVLRTTFERFGIPARFYFAAPLAAHPAVRSLAAVVEAMLGGWDHEQTLAAVRMPASGPGAGDAGDRFDFAVRERLPGRGLAPLKAMAAGAGVRIVLDRLERLDAWRAGEAEPPEWAARAKGLRALAPTPLLTDGVSHETAAQWRSEAAALDGFERAMEETAAALPAGRRGRFAGFWKAAAVVLREMRLRVRDQRRNVVHVLDVYEARQWELPVVFLCGLLERQFPLYHAQDPVFPDAARSLLQRRGIPLRATADLQLEEEFLFELATTRATEELILSYPESNAKGEPNLASFFLGKFSLAAEKAQPVRPAAPGAAAPRSRGARIGSPDLLERLRIEHAVLKPTAIEQFLQCPFQFFADHTLRLEEPPPRPEERLDALLRGTIVHKVLAEWHRQLQPLEPLFDRVFAEACARARVPQGCAVELARLSMRRDLRRFLEDPLLRPGWPVETEVRVQAALHQELEIRGQIDRFDTGPAQQAIVFDYKYSGASRIRERIQAQEEGRVVQAGLYLLALERLRDLTPAGMFYCGLRGEVTLRGWHVPLPGLERVGTSCTPEVLREQLDGTLAAALQAARDIRAGRIEPRAGDACDYCAFHDLCRVAAVKAALAAGGGE
ncbi:MAG: PD-(D/E)XK nuclease family protein [Acidobacteriota bacterium]|mgnify:FL=1